MKIVSNKVKLSIGLLYNSFWKVNYTNPFETWSQTIEKNQWYV